MWLGRMLGGRGVERMAVVLVSWSCLLGVQPASVDTPEPKDHDRILHGKPLSDQVSGYPSSDGVSPCISLKIKKRHYEYQMIETHIHLST